MSKNRFYIITISLILLILVQIIDISGAHAVSVKGTVQAAYGLSHIGQGINQDSGKVKFVDNGYYYFLNTGEKKSFLIEEDTYFIVYKKGVSPAVSGDELQNRFINDFNVVSRHSLRKQIKFRIKKGRKR